MNLGYLVSEGLCSIGAKGDGDGNSSYKTCKA